MPKDPRAEFAERVRLQIASRYRDSEVTVDPDAFTVRLVAPGHDVAIPLNPLFHQSEVHPEKTSSLIANFVANIESKLSLELKAEFSLAVPLWCVRSTKYLESVGRSDELLTREVAGDLVAFVAQPAPNQAMRGIPRGEWERSGFGVDEIVAAANRNTRERFEGLVARIKAIDRIPADGWRIAVDELFCGSILVIPEVLENLAAKAGGDVLLANPDRSVVLAVAAQAKGASTFQRRATREWREAMHPCSTAVLITDGNSLSVPASDTRESRGLMGWLKS